MSLITLCREFNSPFLGTEQLRLSIEKFFVSFAPFFLGSVFKARMKLKR